MPRQIGNGGGGGGGPAPGGNGGGAAGGQAITAGASRTRRRVGGQGRRVVRFPAVPAIVTGGATIAADPGDLDPCVGAQCRYNEDDDPGGGPWVPGRRQRIFLGGGGGDENLGGGGIIIGNPPTPPPDPGPDPGPGPSPPPDPGPTPGQPNRKLIFGPRFVGFGRGAPFDIPEELLIRDPFEKHRRGPRGGIRIGSSRSPVTRTGAPPPGIGPRFQVPGRFGQPRAAELSRAMRRREFRDAPVVERRRDMLSELLSALARLVRG